MKKNGKFLLIVFVSLIIVLGVNIGGNYQYYAAGGDWHYSVFFSLGFTLLCWLVFSLLTHFVFQRMNWSDRPTFRILTGALIFASVGFSMMLATQWAIIKFTGGSMSAHTMISNCIYSAMISMIIGLIVTGQQALMDLKKSIEDNERMKQEMVQSQYETLKSQVNPHFLFNSLNTLTVMIPQQPDVAVSFVEQLSKVFRYSLQYSGENTIDVGTELKVVRSYLFLNEQRYGSKLKVEVAIGATALAQKIITQSLLMLAENAIKHNEISHEHPLSVHIYDEGKYLVVKNTLQRKKVLEPSTNVGLENIKKRYALASGVPVIIEDTDQWFVVKIPLL